MAATSKQQWIVKFPKQPTSRGVIVGCGCECVCELREWASAADIAQVQCVHTDFSKIFSFHIELCGIERVDYSTRLEKPTNNLQMDANTCARIAGII